MKNPKRTTGSVPTLLVCAAALAAGPVPAGAQIHQMTVFQPGLHSAGLGLGWSMPTASEDMDQALKGGPALNLRYFRYFLGWLALGAEAGYATFGENSRTTAAGAAATMSGSSLSLTVLGRFNLLEERAWTPYMLGGAGFNQVSLKQELVDAAGVPLTTGSFNEKSNRLSFTAGAGFEAFLTRDLSLFAEGRFHRHSLDSGKFSASVLETVGFRIGANFWLGVY